MFIGIIITWWRWNKDGEILTCNQEIDSNDLEQVWPVLVVEAEQDNDDEDDGDQHVDERQREEELGGHEKCWKRNPVCDGNAMTTLKHIENKWYQKQLVIKIRANCMYEMQLCYLLSWVNVAAILRLRRKIKKKRCRDKTKIFFLTLMHLMILFC